MSVRESVPMIMLGCVCVFSDVMSCDMCSCCWCCKLSDLSFDSACCSVQFSFTKQGH